MKTSPLILLSAAWALVAQWALGISLMGLALSAQVVIISNRGASKAPQNWGSLKKDAQRAGGLWVVLDDEASTMAAAVNLSLKSETLIVFDLRLQAFPLKSPLAQEVLALQGWEGKPRWVLLDGRGQVAAEGTQKPTREALEAGLDAAGIKSSLESQEAFLRLHPDHAEALESLLQLRLDLAKRRLAALGLGQEAVPSASNGKKEPVRPLTEDEDRLIWGPVAEALERLLLRSDWQGGGGFWVARLNVPSPNSPLLKTTALRVLPEIENALRRHPSHWMTWDLWLKASDWAGGRAIQPFLATIQPAPGQETSFPPDNVVAAYVKAARARADWAAIRDLMLPRWEQVREREMVFFSAEAEGAPQAAERNQWNSMAEPLVEALLWLGDAGAADRVVQDALAMLRAKGVGTWAAEVAVRCGNASLATRWAALIPAKGK